MNRQDIIDQAKQIVGNNPRSLSMATIRRSGQPHVRYMGAVVVEEPFTVYLETYNRSRKVAEIIEKPEVELLTANQDYSKVVALTGTAEVERSPQKRQMVWKSIPESRQYFKGPDDPDFGVICVKVESVEFWSGKDQRDPFVTKV